MKATFKIKIYHDAMLILEIKSCLVLLVNIVVQKNHKYHIFMWIRSLSRPE